MDLIEYLRADMLTLGAKLSAVIEKVSSMIVKMSVADSGEIGVDETRAIYTKTLTLGRHAKSTTA